MMRRRQESCHASACVEPLDFADCQGSEPYGVARRWVVFHPAHSARSAGSAYLSTRPGVGCFAPAPGLKRARSSGGRARGEQGGSATTPGTSVSSGRPEGTLRDGPGGARWYFWKEAPERTRRGLRKRVKQHRGLPVLGGREVAWTRHNQRLASWYFLIKRPKARRSFWASRAAWVTLPWCTRSSSVM